MNVVYVLAPDRGPLMPCTAVIARLLLKEGKAKVRRRIPFTIQLLAQPEPLYTQPVTHGVDTGSAVVGSAVADEQGNVFYLSEVFLRNDIAATMKERASKRRSRRTRTTRYRPARWLNRKNSIKQGRFSPTMRSKIDAHLREICFVQSLLPINAIILETGTFDPHALKNPEVLHHKWLYQKGINYGFANTKAYVLTRDDYTCQQCKGKSKDKRLEVHHLVFRSQGGSDDETNLLTLCKTCHDGLHAGTITLKRSGKKKGTLAHATHMNSIRIQLLKRLEAEETWGFVTKEHRHCGQEYFIKGRMSTGYAILMGIDGKKVDLKPIPKFEQMRRVSARASRNMSQKPIPRFFSSPT